MRNVTNSSKLLLFATLLAAAAFVPHHVFAGAVNFFWDGTQIENGGTYEFPIGETRDFSTNGPFFELIGEVYTVEDGARTFVGGFSHGFIPTSPFAWPQAGEYEVDFYEGAAPEVSWLLFTTIAHAQFGDPVFIETIAFTVVDDSNEPPTLTNIQQRRSFGGTSIPEGTVFVGNEIVFQADVTDSDSTEVFIEVELNPTSTTTGTHIVQSDTNAPGTVSLTVDEIIPTEQHYASGKNVESYNWRMRAIDAEGNMSEWVTIGDGSASDFTVKVVPLWTQVQSDFPSDELTREWVGALYADGRGNILTDPDRCGPNIADCGCGITSAVMLGTYYGNTQDVDGNDIDPLALDAYLLENNGYDAYGNIQSWEGVVSNYFGERDGFGNIWRHVVFDSGYTYSQSTVDAHLAQAKPVLNRNSTYGHFNVLASNVGSTYTVRDPLWYATETLNDEQQRDESNTLIAQAYHNVFTKARLVNYHDTPLAAVDELSITLASPAELVVTDPSGSRIGIDPRTNETYTDIPGATYECEHSIVSSEDPIDESALHCIKVLRIPEPMNGNYAVQVIGTGEGSYTVSSLALTKQGDTHTSRFNGETSINEEDTFNLEYSSESLDEVILALTMTEIIKQLNETIRNAEMRPLVKFGLLAQVRVLEKLHERGKMKGTNALVRVLQREVHKLQQRNRIPTETADTLLTLLRQLEEQL